MFIKKKLKYFTRPKQIPPDLSGVSGDFWIVWRDVIYGYPAKALTSILKWWFTLLIQDFSVLNQVNIVVRLLNNT